VHRNDRIRQRDGKQQNLFIQQSRKLRGRQVTDVGSHT
jgi:hypothetical protein